MGPFWPGIALSGLLAGGCGVGLAAAFAVLGGGGLLLVPEGTMGPFWPGVAPGLWAVGRGCAQGLGLGTCVPLDLRGVSCW